MISLHRKRFLLISIDRNVAREKMLFGSKLYKFGENSFSFLYTVNIILAKTYRVLPIYVIHRYPLLHRGCSVMHGRDKTSERDGAMLAVPVLFLKHDKAGRFDS